MITPDDIRQKAEKLYLPALRAWLAGASFYPCEISFRKPQASDPYAELREGTARLLAGAREQRGYGYTVELQPRLTQRYGLQSLPVRITIEREDDLLQLIGKQHEAAAFKRAAEGIRAELPQLVDWLPGNVQRVIDHSDVWPELLNVCQYMLNHPWPGLYLRELPVAVHTKFIEEHRGILRRLLDILLPAHAIAPDEALFERRYGLRYDEPLVRVRLLDPALLVQLGLPVSDLSVPLSQIARLDLAGRRCVVTENKLTFLTLPELPGCFAIFGGGFAVELLRQVSWLTRCPLAYWGDLDAQGFQILAQLRAFQPTAISVMMDWETLTAFKQFKGTGEPCTVVSLPRLHESEHELFTWLVHHNLRLEQERIGNDFSCRKLLAIHWPALEV